jgi:hypothetical protein
VSRDAKGEIDMIDIIHATSIEEPEATCGCRKPHSKLNDVWSFLLKEEGVVKLTVPAGDIDNLIASLKMMRRRCKALIDRLREVDLEM